MVIIEDTIATKNTFLEYQQEGFAINNK